MIPFAPDTFKNIIRNIWWNQKFVWTITQDGFDLVIFLKIEEYLVKW